MSKRASVEEFLVWLGVACLLMVGLVLIEQGIQPTHQTTECRQVSSFDHNIGYIVIECR